MDILYRLAQRYAYIYMQRKFQEKRYIKLYTFKTKQTNKQNNRSYIHTT